MAYDPHLENAMSQDPLGNYPEFSDFWVFNSCGDYINIHGQDQHLQGGLASSYTDTPNFELTGDVQSGPLDVITDEKNAYALEQISKNFIEEFNSLAKLKDSNPHYRVDEITNLSVHAEKELSQLLVEAPFVEDAFFISDPMSDWLANSTQEQQAELFLHLNSLFTLEDVDRTIDH